MLRIVAIATTFIETIEKLTESLDLIMMMMMMTVNAN